MKFRDEAGCYVHIPFCDRICPYCDFAVVRFQEARVKRYLDALHAEIAAAPSRGRRIDTMYIGGGTPSTLSADAIRELLQGLFTKFEVGPGTIECTLEANPSRDKAELELWRAAGANRLSIGVQSLDDQELRRLGRTHSAAQALEFVRAARSAGFDNLSLDLIAGAPNQSIASFDRTLNMALECAPPHLSVYGLQIEPQTPYAAWQRRDPSAFPDDDAVADFLEHAEGLLTGAGYRHYEISNFARPGYECAHNLKYWRQSDCFAFGMSAAGYESGLRYRNLRDYGEYCDAVEARRSPREEEERLSAPRRVGEAAVLALRTADGIENEDFSRRFGVDPRSFFADACKKCSAVGLLEVDELGARLTARGRLLANTVCAEFLLPTPSL
ncbi:MAG: radical SAM family heme chaperone HemW [Candidatus Eremiobacteraeota bacterium]|nr:radical SAM family heme chaperone HemW [Candidatus Eremiobacteraeota bacterium]MBC5826486.1 radical SAM family heme chaperone HemW [Candidatus Eremiobacteraeota bacterium]